MCIFVILFNTLLLSPLILSYSGCIAPSALTLSSSSTSDSSSSTLCSMANTFIVQFETCLKSVFTKVKEMPGKIPHLRAIACFTVIIGNFEKNGLLRMCKDDTKRDWIQKYLATLGTYHLLRADEMRTNATTQSSSSSLAFASSSSSSTTFPHYEMAATISTVLLKTELLEADTSDFTVKMRNLAEGTERDTVSFFAKRIPCKCLKAMYRQIKSEPKLGLCIHCEERKERCELMVCSLCMKPQYCSVKCQHEHWPKHKVYCETLRSSKSRGASFTTASTADETEASDATEEKSESESEKMMTLQSLLEENDEELANQVKEFVDLTSE